MKKNFIVTFLIIWKLENSKVKKNNWLLTLLFLVLSIEIILPEYAKIGIAAWRKKQLNNKTRFRKPFNKVSNYAHHDVQIVSDPWFFQMVQTWRKNDRFFLQKWKKALQPWTYKNLPSRVAERARQRSHRLWKINNKRRMKNVIRKKLSRFFLKKQVSLPRQIIFVKKPFDLNRRGSEDLHSKIFFTRADLLPFSFKSLGDGLKKLVLANTGELILSQRCRWIARDKKINLSFTPAWSPKFCYWNVDVLIKLLQSRSDFTTPNALSKLETILQWYTPDMVKSSSDCSYSESILWFKTHPSLLSSSKGLPDQSVALSSDVNESAFPVRLKTLSLEQIEKIFLKKYQFLNSKFFKKLLAALKKKIRTVFRNILYTANGLRLLEKTVRNALVSNIFLCLALYPELLTQSFTVVWNIVMRYCLAEMHRNNQILKMRLNYLRLNYLVKSLKEIHKQIYMGVVPDQFSAYTLLVRRVKKRRAYLYAVDEFLFEDKQLFWMTEDRFDSFFFGRSASKSLYWSQDKRLLSILKFSLTMAACIEVKFLQKRALDWKMFENHVMSLRKLYAPSLVLCTYLSILDRFFMQKRWTIGPIKYEVRRYPNRVWDLRTYWRWEICTDVSKKYYFNYLRSVRRVKRQEYLFKNYRKTFVKKKIWKKKIVLRRKKKPLTLVLRNKMRASQKNFLKRSKKKGVVLKKNKKTNRVAHQIKKKSPLFDLKKINNWNLVLQKNKPVYSKKLKLGHLPIRYLKIPGFWFSTSSRSKRLVLARKGKNKNQKSTLPKNNKNKVLCSPTKKKTAQFFQLKRCYKKMFKKSKLVYKIFNLKKDQGNKKIRVTRNLILDLLFRHSPIIPVNKILFQAVPRKDLIKHQIKIRFLRQKSFSQIRKLISIFFNIRRKFLSPYVKKKKIFAASKGRRVLVDRKFFKTCSTKYCSKIKVKPFKYAKYRRYRFLQHEIMNRGLFKKVWLKSFLEYYLSVYWQVLIFYGITSHKKKRLKILRRPRTTFRRKFRTRFFTPFLYFNRLMFYFVYKKQKRWLRYSRVPWKKKRRIFRKNRFKKVFVKLWKSRKRFVFLKGLKMQNKFHGPIFISLKTRELKEFSVSAPKQFNTGLLSQNFRIGIFKKNLKNDFFFSKLNAYNIAVISFELKKMAATYNKYSFFFYNFNKIFSNYLKNVPQKRRLFGKKIIPIIVPFSTPWYKLQQRKKQIFKNKFLKKYWFKLQEIFKLFMRKYMAARLSRSFLFPFLKLPYRHLLFYSNFSLKYVKRYWMKKNFFFKYLSLSFLSQVLFPLWKDVFSKENQEEMSMINIFSYLPGLHMVNSRFNAILFSAYLQNLNHQRIAILKGDYIISGSHYKKYLRQYVSLLQLFYKNYYSVKKAKALPTHYGIYLVYKYLYLTAQVDLSYLNRRRDNSSRLLRLVNVSRYINRKGSGVVRKKKNLFKINTLLDRLFFWLYRAPNISYLLSSKIKKAYSNANLSGPQFVYRKRVKFLV